MIEILKSLWGSKFCKTAIIIIIIHGYNIGQNSCCSNTCPFITDLINDSNNQCLLLPNLGPGITLDPTRSFYSWQKRTSKGIENDTMFVRGVGPNGLKALRRTYIHPTPFWVPQIGKSRARKQVYLAKYYFYNMPEDRCDAYILTHDLEEEITQNNWFIYETKSSTDPRAVGTGLRRQQNNNTANMDPYKAACLPQRINPWAQLFSNFIVPAAYVAVGFNNPPYIVITPPTLNGSLGLLLNPTTGGVSVRMRVMRVTQAGNVINLGNVIATPNIISRFAYSINPGDVIWVEPDPTTFTPVINPDGTITFITPYDGGTFGSILAPVSNRRCTDTICVYGTESPIVGEDVDGLGNVILP